MPNGDNNRHHGAFVDHPSYAPFEADVLLLHVNFALWKHMDPLALVQFIDACVHGWLKYATTAHTGNTLAVHEKGRMALLCEANVMGGKGPPNSLSTAYIFHWEYT